MAGFDPTHSVRFDVPKGSVVAGGGERHVLVPCATLDDLVHTAGAEAAAAVGRALGAAIGERVVERLGGVAAVRARPAAEVVRELAGELATRGLGVATVERWGKAVVVAVERPAFADAQFLAAIVEGVLARAAEAVDPPDGRPGVKCAPLGREGGTVRVLVGSEGMIGRARAMLGAGVTWGDVLVRIQQKGGGT
jgi:hypothetical protein